MTAPFARSNPGAERRFYEMKAEKGSASVSVLARQIHTFLFARLLKSRGKAGVLALADQRQRVGPPIDIIKHTMFSIFNLPDQARLRESDFENRNHRTLQTSLLEPAKGLLSSPVSAAWQTDSQYFSVDLGYNYLKCLVSVDLQIGRLEDQEETH